MNSVDILGCLKGVLRGISHVLKTMFRFLEKKKEFIIVNICFDLKKKKGEMILERDSKKK